MIEAILWMLLLGSLGIGLVWIADRLPSRIDPEVEQEVFKRHIGEKDITSEVKIIEWN